MFIDDNAFSLLTLSMFGIIYFRIVVVVVARARESVFLADLSYGRNFRQVYGVQNAPSRIYEETGSHRALENALV